MQIGWEPVSMSFSLPGLLFLTPPPSESDLHSFGFPRPENNWEILLVNTLTLNKKIEDQTLHFEGRVKTPASVLLTSRQTAALRIKTLLLICKKTAVLSSNISSRPVTAPIEGLGS